MVHNWMLQYMCFVIYYDLAFFVMFYFDVNSVQYATVKIGTQLYMTPENMIRDYLGMQSDDRYNESTLKLLAGVVDQTKDGYVWNVHTCL